MPVRAGSPVTTTVRPRIRTLGRPAGFALSPVGRRPRAGVILYRRAPAGVTTRIRPAGVPRPSARVTAAGSANVAAVVAVRLSIRSRSALPEVVRYWRAVNRVAHAATRSVVRSTRARPRDGRRDAARTWRPGRSAAGASLSVYGARVAAGSARPSSV